MNLFHGSVDESLLSEIFHIFTHCLTHTLIILPLLFLSYLIIEYVTHKHTDKIKSIISKETKFGALIGALLGLIPQCGFSATVSNLYSKRIVSVGTLLAVFIATSDEAIAIFIAHPKELPMLILLLSMKFVLGLGVGLILDKLFPRLISVSNEIEIEDSCECSCCSHSHKNLFIGALKHTLMIFIFIYLFSVITEVIIHLIGEDTLNQLLLSGSIFQPIIATFIGLIPVCASSVLLTNLYVSGSLSFASLLAGLITNAGVGIVVLFKNNKNKKENIKILLLLITISLIVGILGSLISLFI